MGRSLLIFVLCFFLPQHSLTAPLSSSKRSEGTTNDGHVFNNVYNSGLSASQTQEILKRMKSVEEKLHEIELKGMSKGNYLNLSVCPPVVSDRL